MTALDALVPLASVLLGAWITYTINVRSRRRTYVEDLFNEAIAAVAVAASSIDYIADAGRPQHLTDEEFAELRKWMVIDAIKNWVKKVAAAGEAVARVLPYQAELADWLPVKLDSQNRNEDELIATLKRGREAQ